MSEFGAYIKKIRESKGLTLNQVALYSEISAAQLSRIETGKRGVPKPNTIKKISEALKVDYDELMKVAGYIDDDKPSNDLPPLSEKEERDIAKQLEKILESMDSDTALSFDGEPMDEVTKELVRAAIENNLRLTKQLAKKKFTPKKYRKD
ncbi:helix-turn-helix domain-containing protein [Peribacillus tepidiphilus]|uniref:helix-turn-helix domain-containing protein n=1 Tax=Peribacillus tepidiphilus TaxID=2652445 RepID=UPI001292B85E|nr:helix-turn-helix transcriptional regulator [Peribacillus tepidiphilus]